MEMTFTTITLLVGMAVMALTVIMSCGMTIRCYRREEKRNLRYGNAFLMLGRRNKLLREAALELHNYTTRLRYERKAERENEVATLVDKISEEMAEDEEKEKDYENS